MQRFTLLHDSSAQAWQTTYLAFHVTAQLGAPLRVLIFDTDGNRDKLAENAEQVEVGGRAAGVTVITHLLPDFSVAYFGENGLESNGLFIPRRLISDEKTARLYLDTVACPLWIVSKESKLRGIAVLVRDFAADRALIDYTTNLANRIKRPLTGFIRKSEFDRLSETSTDITWFPLSDFSQAGIGSVVNRIGDSLLFLLAPSFSLVKGFAVNCVLFPDTSDA
jgi:hypothetical protein